MMKFTIEGSVSDKITVNLPPSKSYAQRALIAASLANGESIISMNRPFPEDIVLMIRALKKMGIKIIGNKVYGQQPKRPQNILNMGGSGTGIRFMTAFSTLATGGYTVLTGNSSLIKRPLGPLTEAINALGGFAITAGEDGRPPVIVKGKKMKGGRAEIRSSESSQYVSALLLVSPKNEDRTEIRWTNKVSEHYVKMTEFVMNHFGVKVYEDKNSYFVEPSEYKPSSFVVPLDASSASFFVILGILTGRTVKIPNLKREPIQADLEELIKVLDFLNVKYYFDKSGMQVEGKVPEASLNVDLKNAPDLFPPLSVLGYKVPLEISGISHVRYKESNRLLSMSSELTKLGCFVELKDDKIKILPPNSAPENVELKGWKDHRVVMSLSILCAAQGIKCVIDGYEAVKKSFPGFFEEMKKNGLKVKLFER
jgi:3-phosphoshikimate 1-carboxyvinyltransferase